MVGDSLNEYGMVLKAMRRFPDDAQVQGLGCLALANLAYKNDANLLQIAEDGGIRVIVRAMRAFPDDAKVQAVMDAVRVEAQVFDFLGSFFRQQ